MSPRLDPVLQSFENSGQLIPTGRARNVRHIDLPVAKP